MAYHNALNNSFRLHDLIDKKNQSVKKNFKRNNKRMLLKYYNSVIWNMATQKSLYLQGALNKFYYVVVEA